MKFGQDNSTWNKLEEKCLQDSLLAGIANFSKGKKLYNRIKGNLINKVAFWKELF